MGAAVKKEFVRFYEVFIDKNQVSVEKSYDDNVIGEMYNCRKFSDWVKKWEKTSKLYSLVRRTALDKKMTELGTKFIRWIIFASAISEYFENHKALKSKSAYIVMRCAIWLLACNLTKSKTPPSMFSTFFKLYKWDQTAPHNNIDDTKLNTVKTHNNSKSNKAFNIPKMQHFNILTIKHFNNETFSISTFQQCKILLQPMSKQLVLFCMSLKVKTICLRPSDSSVPRNTRQTYNLKAKKRAEK